MNALAQMPSVVLGDESTDQILDAAGLEDLWLAIDSLNQCIMQMPSLLLTTHILA